MERNWKRTKQSIKLEGSITSISDLDGSGQYFYISTDQSNSYGLQLSSMSKDVIHTGHTAEINDIAFAL